MSWTAAEGGEWIDGGLVAPQARLAAAGEDLVVLVRPAGPADPERGSTLHIGRIAP